MTLPDDGLILIVKSDCPTCQLVTSVARELADEDFLAAVLSQDDPAFPAGLSVIDDGDLELSFDLDVEVVPTLIHRRGGDEVGRVVGWDREQWRVLTGIGDLGSDLPDHRPGCGSLSAGPGMEDELRSRYGHTGLRSRTISVEFPDDESEQMFSLGWTDGLPVVAPTPARVLRMLGGTTLAPDHIIGDIPPALAPCTVEKAAVNAVMAGCKPEYFPVVLAGLEAVLDPAFNWYTLGSTTMGVGLVVVVNGPIVKRIGMNSGHNAMGHGNRANATIGRAVQLVAHNVGGSSPGGVDRSTQGHPGKFGLCFAEDESDDDWQPLSVAAGHPADGSAVTAFGSIGSTLCFSELSRDGESLSRSLAASLQVVEHPKAVGLSAMLVLSHEHWAVFKREGWSRSDIDVAIREAGTRPGSELVQGAGGIGDGLAPDRANGDFAKFDAGELHLVRAGSRAGLSSTILAGFDNSFLSKLTTKVVRP